jgi:putative NIF3 family GTP cyclohydrolase 1 type 2
LEEYAPLAHAESYDNVGLLVGEATARVCKALVVLDVTERVVEYASENGYGLVVAHHPIWFGAKKRLTGEDFSSRCILKAVRAGVALYAAHTNLDNVRHGVNAKICEKLGLENTAVLLPHPGDGNVGSGMVGTFARELNAEDFLEKVKNTFRTKSYATVAEKGRRYVASPCVAAPEVFLYPPPKKPGWTLL